MPDELEYSELAKSFASSGHYLFRTHAFALRTIYPALISPAWLAHSMSTTYGIAKALNVVMMTSSAVPVYFWARRLVPPLWSVIAIALFLAIPSFSYTSELLTENAYLPAVCLAVFLLALTLERCTLARQLLVLGGVALSLAIRPQGIIFLLIVPTAIVLKLFLDLRAVGSEGRSNVIRGASKWWPTAAVVGAAVIAYVVYSASRGAALSAGFGNASGVFHVHYSVREVSRWAIYHFAELAFSVGVIPFSALIVLTGLACRRASAPSSAERAFLATSVAAVFWTVLQAAAFASRFSLRIEERYMLTAAPLLLLSLVVWLARGLPRPPGLTAAAALMPAVLLLMVPYTGFLSGILYNDTFGLIPVYRLTTRIGNYVEPEVLVGLGMLVAGLLFASVGRRTAQWAVPAAVFAFLVVSSASVYATVKFVATAARHAGGLTGDPSWIDHRIGQNARAEFLYTTDIDVDQHILWQAEFWNRSLRRVYGVTSNDPSLPDLSAPLNPLTGRIVPVLPVGSPDRSPHYVVGAQTIDVDGAKLAAAGVLALHRVDPPLRLASTVEGVQPDGWTGATAAFNGYVRPSTPTRLPVLLSRTGVAGPPPAHVRVVIGPLRLRAGVLTVGTPWASKTVTVRNGRQLLVHLPIRRIPFRVELSVAPTFSPSQFGSADTRELGVRAFFVNELG